MKTRCFPSAMLFVAMHLLLGCGVATNTSDGPEDRESQSKTEKTKAELLVGTWNHVKRTPPKAKGNESTFDYTKDGRVRLRKFNPRDGEEIETGTYRVEGSMLLLNMDTHPTERNVTIELITEDKLVTSGFSGSTRMVSEYERVRGK